MYEEMHVDWQERDSASNPGHDLVSGAICISGLPILAMPSSSFAPGMIAVEAVNV